MTPDLPISTPLLHPPDNHRRNQVAKNYLRFQKIQTKLFHLRRWEVRPSGPWWIWGALQKTDGEFKHWLWRAVWWALTGWWSGWFDTNTWLSTRPQLCSTFVSGVCWRWAFYKRALLGIEGSTGSLWIHNCNKQLNNWNKQLQAEEPLPQHHPIWQQQSKSELSNWKFKLRLSWLILGLCWTRWSY